MSAGDFLAANGWRLVEDIDLGTTARVFVVERNGLRRVLKLLREGPASALRLEYDLLHYLNGTPMAHYVPAVGAWEDKAAGFWMEYLRYPAPEERAQLDLPAMVGDALRTLHALPLPSLAGLPDDRPDGAVAVARRLRESFGTMLDDGCWAGLAAEDVGKLRHVRARHTDYAALLPALKVALTGVRCTLTHGDLSGDNLMVRPDGSLALADWGAARIAPPLTDVTCLLVHVEWNDADTHRFLRAYAGAEQATLDLLTGLVRYDSCVRSLRWLAEDEEGLDAVGRAFFEQQLGRL